MDKCIVSHFLAHGVHVHLQHWELWDSVRCNCACRHENISWNSLSQNISKWRMCYTQSPLSCSLQRSSELSTTTCGDTSSDGVCCDFWTTCGPSHFTGDNRSSSQTYVIIIIKNCFSRTTRWAGTRTRQSAFVYFHVAPRGSAHPSITWTRPDYDTGIVGKCPYHLRRQRAYERWLHNMLNIR